MSATTYSVARIAALVAEKRQQGLSYASAVAAVSRATGIGGGSVMRAVMQERDKK